MLVSYDTCDGCSALVRLTPSSVMLAVATLDGAGRGPEMLFSCSGCGFATRRVVEWRQAMAFISSGATVLSGVTLVPPTPAEVADPVRAERRPLTFDDVLDLHQGLAQPDWQDQLGSCAEC
jgi:hypothetical protein